MSLRIAQFCALLSASIICGCSKPATVITLQGSLGQSAAARAIYLAMPTYPAESIAKGRSGPAIVSIRVSQNGRVTDAVLLQSPDTQSGIAALAAAKSSTFKMPQSQNNATFAGQGRLFYYFLLTPNPHIEIAP